jgi:autotransporter-associated beta strand protein
MKQRRPLLPLAVSIAALIAPGYAADFQKVANTDPLTGASSWAVINGADPDGIPDSDDLLIWDFSVTAPNISTLGGDLSVQGLQIGGVGGGRNAAANYVGITGNTNTLTIGSGGIDMGGALQPLRIESRVALTADQTWNIADASTAGVGFNKAEDLAFFGMVAGVPLNLGGFTITKAGTGMAAIGTGYTLSNGVINVTSGILQLQSGGTRTTTVTGDVSINVSSGASLRIASESGSGGIAIASSGIFTLNAGSTFLTQLNQNNAMNLNGNIKLTGDVTWQVQGAGFTSALATFAGNLIGSSTVTYQNTATQTNGLMRFTGDNSGFTGTININGASNNRILRLAGANAGSANATWAIAAANTLQIDGVPVQLGTISGNGTIAGTSGSSTISVGGGDFPGIIQDSGGSLGLTKVGSGTLTLTALNNYSGGTTVAGGTLIINSGQTGGGAISVSDGSTLGLKVTAANTTFAASSLTLGSTTGSTLQIDLGTFGSPTVPVIAAPTFARNGTTTIKILGSGFNGTTFRLVDYTSTTGAGTITLTLPFRVTGSITDNAATTSLDLTLTADGPKWRGNINGNWDIDPNNNGAAGTANWRTAVSDVATRYVEGPAGIDSVIFDETATGTRTVNLTTTLSPASVGVNNTTTPYKFVGAGKISGAGGLTKRGSGTLILANDTAFDYTGGTLVAEGTLQIGDGTTPGIGITPAGNIINNATLLLNRPDDFALTATVTGTGTLVKSNVNTVTVASASSLGNVAINSGTLRYNSGGTIDGLLSGTGTLEVAGGTLQIAGTGDNTYTGTTNITAGTLQLNRTGGNAIGGTINFTGTGGITLSQQNQIADTAIINYDKATNGGNIVLNETVAAINMLNGNDAGAQVQAANGFNVTGLITGMNTSLFSVASNATGSVGGLNISGSAIIRVAANNNPSTLNVGQMGITASGGTVQVGQGTGAFDAVLNLDGNVTTTGNFNFTDGNFTGPNLRLINLNTSATFNVAELTTTSIAPDIGGFSTGIIKAGNGTLVLTAASSSNYTGDTKVNAGFLEVNGSINGTAKVDLATGGTLAGIGTIAPASGGNVTLLAGGKLSPGQAFTAGTLNITLSGGGALQVAAGVAGVNTQALLFDLDPFLSDKITLDGGALNIGSGVLEFDDFAFTPSGSFDPAATYTLFDSSLPIVGTLGAARTGILSGQPFQLQFANNNTDLILAPVPEPGSATFGGVALGLLAIRRRRSVHSLGPLAGFVT